MLTPALRANLGKRAGGASGLIGVLCVLWVALDFLSGLAYWAFDTWGRIEAQIARREAAGLA